MGIAKEEMNENQRAKLERKLAGVLGITYAELSEIGFEIQDNKSEDGLLYSYIIEFPDDSNPEILEKIIGLEDGKRVWLEPSELDI